MQGAIGVRGRVPSTLCAVLLLVSVLASCTASVTGGERKEGYLVVALKEAPGSLDPTRASSYVGRIVFANMCEKLYDVDQRLQLVPQLADGMPEVSDGGRTYTIHLRQGVLFNDGTPMDAAAVKTSLDRHKSDKLSQRSSELKPVTSVEVVAPDVVRLHLSQPFAPLTSILADRAGMVLSPAALQRYGDAFGQHPVCVGPFSFSSEPNPDEINLSRSQYYYDRDQVHLPGVTFRVVTEDNARATDLRSGDVDVVDRASPQDVTALRSDPALSVRPVTGLGYQGITINTGNANGYKNPPAAPDTPLARSPLLRKAFELSLDRDVINRVVFDGSYVADCTPIPPGGPWTLRVPCTHRDIAQARQLVSQSGERTPIPVTLMVQNSALQEQLGTIIQAMAKDAGFAVQVEPSDFTTALTRGQQGKYDAFQVGWSGRLDADQNISQQWLPGSAQNYAGSHDPQTTALITQARQATDPAQRLDLYQRLVARMNDSLDIIYLYHEVYTMALRKDVSGVAYYGDGLIRLKTASINRR
jgi:peptide/nickel transport system substrate-binding protein